MRTARRPILEAQPPEPRAYDGMDTTYPSVLRVTGPASLLDKDDFRIRTLDGLRRIVKRDGQYYVATRDGDRPDVMLLLATQLDDGWITDNDPPPDQSFGLGVRAADPFGLPFEFGGPCDGPNGGILDSGCFLAGFVHGFVEGGVQLGWGTVRTAVMLPINSVKYAWALVTRPRSTLKETYRQGQEMVEVATNVGWLAWQLANEGWEFVSDVADEMPTTTTLPVAQMPPTLRIAMELGAEVIGAAVQDALDFYVDHPYDSGRVVGRGMFEIRVHPGAVREGRDAREPHQARVPERGEGAEVPPGRSRRGDGESAARDPPQGRRVLRLVLPGGNDRAR